MKTASRLERQLSFVCKPDPSVPLKYHNKGNVMMLLCCCCFFLVMFSALRICFHADMNRNTDEEQVELLLQPAERPPVTTRMCAVPEHFFLPMDSVIF